MRLLIDANVYRQAAGGSYVHINDELSMWGPRLIATRHLEYRFRPPRKRKAAEKVQAIPALATQGKLHGCEFFTYWLIDYEMENMPPAFDWIGRSTFDLFSPTALPRIEPSYHGVIGSCDPGFDLFAALRKFIIGIKDERFQQILEAFGTENSQDAFHVWTCERHSIDCIVTVDGKLQAKLRQVRKRLALKVDAQPPWEICRRLGIEPIDKSWFEANDEFRNTRMIPLFDRYASRKDRMIFRLYTICVALSRRWELSYNFVIPGYDEVGLK